MNAILQKLLNANSKIQITSGEGDEEGTTEEFTGRKTARAVSAALKRERCNGDRWARATVYEGESIDGIEFGYDAETMEPHIWIVED